MYLNLFCANINPSLNLDNKMIIEITQDEKTQLIACVYAALRSINFNGMNREELAEGISAVKKMEALILKLKESGN